MQQGDKVKLRDGLHLEGRTKKPATVEKVENDGTAWVRWPKFPVAKVRIDDLQPAA